jgi:prephenate dehydrogenase
MTDLGRVTVIGLGQTGGSLAIELTRGRHARVTGYDSDPSVRRRAQKLKMAARVTGELAGALRGADIVVLAVPVASIIAALLDPAIPFDPESLVMDVGSTKRLVLGAADRRRPPLHFVGGHPLAGNERPGLDGVEVGLFRKRSFALVPGRHARAKDVATARRLVRALGARPLLMDADLHDRITALTIGLPHSIAFLVRDLYDRAALADRRVQELAGGSIWSTMRVSKSDPTMVGDLIATNRDYIEAWWARLISAPGMPRPSRGAKAPRRRRSR